MRDKTQSKTQATDDSRSSLVESLPELRFKESCTQTLRNIATILPFFA